MVEIEKERGISQLLPFWEWLFLHLTQIDDLEKNLKDIDNSISRIDEQSVWPISCRPFFTCRSH